MRLSHLLPIAFLALSACNSTTVAPTSAAFAPSPTTSTTAGPGSSLPSADIAGEVFGKACLAAQPDFQNTAPALASLGFVQNSETGTYYSPQYNMSLKLFEREVNKECSIVFATDGNAEATARAFGEAAAANGNGKTGDVRVRFQPVGDQTYINARIITPQ